MSPGRAPLREARECRPIRRSRTGSRRSSLQDWSDYLRGPPSTHVLGCSRGAPSELMQRDKRTGILKRDKRTGIQFEGLATRALHWPQSSIGWPNRLLEVGEIPVQKVAVGLMHDQIKVGTVWHFEGRHLRKCFGNCTTGRSGNHRIGADPTHHQLRVAFR